jgi:hypothetical protein
MTTALDALTNQQRVAYEIGRLTIVLSGFDRHLPKIYEAAAGTGHEEAERAVLRKHTLQGQLDLIEAALEGNRDLRPIIRLIQRRRRLQRQRNRLQHDVWMSAGTTYYLHRPHPGDLRRTIEQPPKSRPKRISPERIAIRVARAQQITGALIDWLVDQQSPMR